MSEGIYFSGDVNTDCRSDCVVHARRKGSTLSQDGYGYHGTIGQNFDSILAAGLIRRGPRSLDVFYAPCLSALFRVALDDYSDKSASFSVVFGAHLRQYIKCRRGPSEYLYTHEAWMHLKHVYLVWRGLDPHHFVLGPQTARWQPTYTGAIPAASIQRDWLRWSGP